MRYRRHCFPLIILGAAMFMGACVPTTPEPTPIATPCPSIPLLAPQVFFPNSELVPSLQPTFQWFYGVDCGRLDAFGLDIALDGDFTAPGVINEQTSGPQTTWTLTQALQPASMYKWRVYAIRGFTTGPYSPSPWFWIGPICDASIPDIPELVSPIQGVIISDPSPPLEWSYPDVGCLPEGYQFQVSTQPDFHQTVLSGQSPGPWTSFETNVDFLQDCTTYYWRVAVLHSLLPAEYSDVEDFSTDFQGTCSWTAATGTQIYVIGCIGTQSMMITFEFPRPPYGNFEARAEGNLYECVPNDERILLHCSGPRIETVPAGLIELIETQTGRVMFLGQARFPNCDLPPCSGLPQLVCTERSDCTWVPGVTHAGAGFCKDN